MNPSTLSITGRARRQSGHIYSMFFHPSDSEPVVVGRIESPFLAYVGKGPFESLQYLPTFENTGVISSQTYTSSDTDYGHKEIYLVFWV